jgi:hypothetical protein
MYNECLLPIDDGSRHRKVQYGLASSSRDQKAGDGDFREEKLPPRWHIALPSGGGQIVAYRFPDVSLLFPDRVKKIPCSAE